MHQITGKKQFCQSLKVKYALSAELESYYNDIQSDYQMLLGFCVKNSGLAYTIETEKGFLVVEPTASKESVREWVGVVGKGGTPAWSSYVAFRANYKPLAYPKSNNRYSLFVRGRQDLLPMHLMPLEDFREKIKKLDCITPAAWENYRERALGGEEVWEEIAPIVGSCPAAKLAMKVRPYIPSIKRPDDPGYCQALMFMVSSAFNSWCECHQLHLEETTSLETQLMLQKKDREEVFSALVAFSAKLDALNYGLSKKVLIKVIDALEGKGYSPFFALACEEAFNYPALKTASKDNIWKAYDALRTYNRLLRRKKYIGFPKMQDYQVPFGLTGRGHKFQLKIEHYALKVTIDGKTLTCMPSYYFNDLAVDQSGNGYSLRFRHKLKDKYKDVYGSWISARVNEIKLLKKGDSWFVYLPYQINHSPDNFYLERFFQSAEPLSQEMFKKVSLKEEMVATGFDLNLSTPLTATTAKLIQGSRSGSVHALDYGHGEIVSSVIVCSDTPLCKSISGLTLCMRKLTNAIREHKIAKKNGIALEEETLAWLRSEVKEPLVHSSRHQIQTLMKQYLQKERHYWFTCFLNGHTQLSESIQLLRLLDASISLHKSYENINNYTEEVAEEQTEGMYLKRDNFRDYINKQYASQIVKYCIGTGTDIAFIEDLQMVGDSDKSSKENSLTQLFAAGQLKKTIENALHKVGKGCVFVPPAGTSRKDPVSGLIGYRDKFNKTKLYVLRGGKIGFVHADLVGSMNVLLLGLSHSIVPYKHYAGRKLEDKKRINRFLKLYLKPRGKGWYYFVGKWIPDRVKRLVEDRIKKLCLKQSVIQEFSLLPCVGGVYRSFQVVEAALRGKALPRQERVVDTKIVSS